DSSPVRGVPALGTEEPVYSTRRVTRSQQQPAPVTPKKYPLRQTRSSGSETEHAVDFSDRGTALWGTQGGIWGHREGSGDTGRDLGGHRYLHFWDTGRDLGIQVPASLGHRCLHFWDTGRDLGTQGGIWGHREGFGDTGHLTGKHERHFSISGCPLYHNLSADECKVRAQSRDKQIEERMLAHRQDDNNRHATRHQAPTERQLRYKEKVAELRKKRNSGLSKEQKEKYMEHRQTYGNTREPLLENLTSEYDLELFRRAQARASEDLEKLRLQGQITEGSNMIKTIAFGRYELDTWYHSPYPEEYARLGRLYMCEFCLKYMKSQTILRRHMAKCVWKHPPGDEIYRKGSISVFEVDGKKNKV
ncbi:KAT7 acetyltransferase, partial [Pycnonotus jocosus]|nr:KAT7 acetyltransferase [Pycnonotus jocosus]